MLLYHDVTLRSRSLRSRPLSDVVGSSRTLGRLRWRVLLSNLALCSMFSSPCTRVSVVWFRDLTVVNVLETDLDDGRLLRCL